MSAVENQDLCMPSPEATEFSLQDVMNLIPHRYPMLLLEKVIDVVKGESATGIKNVSINEWFFQGHFPEKPVMPGVLIIEALAQTAGTIAMHHLQTPSDNKLVYFMSIDSVKFRKPVVPGDVLHLCVKKIQQRGPVWKFKSQAKVNGVVVAEAVNTAMIADNTK